MPLARIDLPMGKGAAYGRAIADVVYETLRTHLNVPEHDRFQIITEHSTDTLLIDPEYLGIARSDDALIIQLTISEGRSVAIKQSFYAALVEALAARVGLRREDVMIVLTEVKKENWSFGNGAAQYVV